MSSLKLRELAASYRSYGSELSFRARYVTCVARTILNASDCVWCLYRPAAAWRALIGCCVRVRHLTTTAARISYY